MYPVTQYMYLVTQQDVKHIYKVACSYKEQINHPNFNHHRHYRAKSYLYQLCLCVNHLLTAPNYYTVNELNEYFTEMDQLEKDSRWLPTYQYDFYFYKLMLVECSKELPKLKKALSQHLYERRQEILINSAIKQYATIRIVTEYNKIKAQKSHPNTSNKYSKGVELCSLIDKACKKRTPNFITKWISGKDASTTSTYKAVNAFLSNTKPAGFDNTILSTNNETMERQVICQVFEMLVEGYYCQHYGRRNLISYDLVREIAMFYTGFFYR